jgi:prepilin-type N-terminal cleavage/methylation domain-containing protein
MLKKLNKNRGGFTLVEIMIVVAIIALLASIAVPSFMRARKRSQATRIKEEARLIDAAVDQYAIEYNLEPGDTLDWEKLTSYFKGGTRLTQLTAAEDLFGNEYEPLEVDSSVKVNTATKEKLSDVLDASFWDPF